MKIATQLNGEFADGEFQDQSGILQQVIDEPVKGFFRSTKLTRQAMLIKRGDHCVVFPLEVLHRLAEQHEPALIPKPPAQPVAPIPSDQN